MPGLLRLLVACSLAFVVIALWSDPALAQCSMCKAVLSSTRDSSFIKSYNLGVLVLLLPPVTIFCSIFIALRRHKGEADRDSETDKLGQGTNR
jgi:uncharacterized paraquat-inducible protein A